MLILMKHVVQLNQPWSSIVHNIYMNDICNVSEMLFTCHITYIYIHIYRIGILKYENGLLPLVMHELYLRNNKIHNYDIIYQV